MLAVLNPIANSRAALEAVNMFRRHRTLTFELTRREIGERYAGQVLGSTWAIGHPIALMVIYVFVFTELFKIALPAGMPLDKTAHLVAGLAPWMGFQESMMVGTTSVSARANLVKQVVFPIEVLPIKGVFIALVSQVIMIGLLIGYIAIWHGTAHWTYLLLPVLIGIQAVGMAGVAMLLAAVGVYFRDVKDLVQVFSTACMFMMPLFYTLADTGDYAWLLLFNPFTHLLGTYRDVLYFGAITQPISWVILIVLSTAAFCIGYRTFRRLKPMFGNVL